MFDRICTEVFWEAHRRAFEFFTGVPRRITHRIHVLEANGESYRLRESKRRLARRTRAARSKQS